MIKKLGKGGAGEIFLVKDEISKDLKVLKKMTDFSETIDDEFLILRNLHHPNLVQVSDLIKTSAEESYLVEEYVVVTCPL